MNSDKQIEKAVYRRFKQIIVDRKVNPELCIQCREPALPKCYSEAGKREFAISGMCEECFDNLFKEEEQ